MIVHYQSSGLFSQSRCTLENWGSFQYNHANDENPNTKRIGIRCHNFIVSLILRLFGKIHIETTSDGKSVYLNRKSFEKWIKWRGFSDTSSKAKATANKAESVLHRTIKTQPEGYHPLSNSAKTFRQTVAHECSKDLGKIWGKLLTRIPTNEIVRFEITSENKYILTFNHPVTLWLNSRSRDGTRSSPKGGTIVLLGHNKSHTLEFTADPESKAIKYEKGMQLYCDTNTTGIGRRILDVVSMSDKDPETIILKAGCKILFSFRSKEKPQSKESYLKVWSQATLLTGEEDYKNYLDRKALLC